MGKDMERMPPSTSALLCELMKTLDFRGYVKRNITQNTVLPLREYLKALCAQKDMIPARVIERAGINRVYGHQVFNGTRKPSRDKVIQIAIGFQLNVEETQKLLKAADCSELYPRIQRDSALLYCINKRMTFIDTQQFLYDDGSRLLDGDKDGI